MTTPVLLLVEIFYHTDSHKEQKDSNCLKTSIPE